MRTSLVEMDKGEVVHPNESLLPMDQHGLLALIAPRSVYVASAQEDLWADPKGEYLAAYDASAVYRLFDQSGLFSEKMPDIRQSIQNTVGYHVREGVHYVTDYDWEQYIKWAKRVLR